MGPLASFFVVRAPSRRTIAMEAFARNISTTSEVLIERLVDTMLACDVWVCNSCKPIQIAPKIICCCCSNCYRSSVVTSRTVSPMSCKSSSVRVIGSNDVLLAFLLLPWMLDASGHRLWVHVVFFCLFILVLLRFR